MIYPWIYKGFTRNVEREGSDWVLDEIIEMRVQFVAFANLAGSCHFKLEPRLQAKKAVINVVDNEYQQKCFTWVI